MSDRQQQQQRKPRPSQITYHKGYVKGVSTGDTLIIVSLDEKSARAPVEYELTLAGIQAPLPALYIPSNPSKSREDKPWAWQSREFLRKKLIGQPVVYCITHNLSGNRRCGIVYHNERDIREDIVAAGWASVRTVDDAQQKQQQQQQQQPKSKTMQRLLELEEKAKKEGKGIYNTDKRARSVRHIIYNFDAFDVFEKLKGRHISAIVEQVRTGTTLKVYLPEGSYSLSLLLSGAQSPTYVYSNPDDEQEPFAREARFFTELRVLHRDVDIVFEGIDKSKNFFGTVICNGENLALSLLKEGLAKFVDWSGSKTSNIDALRNAEREAQQKGLRIWQKAAPTNASKASKKEKSRNDFTARVVDIINAGTIAIFDERKGQEERISLSSITPPRMLPRDKLKDPQVPEEDKWEAAYAWEARELLRRRLIGQRVRVVLDYVRQVAKDGKEKPFYSVYYDKRNVALDLVEKGLAKVVEHRGQDSRSAEYEEMVLAESKAQKRGLGLHASKGRRPVLHFSDYTLPTDQAPDQGVIQAQVAKLQSYLPHLQRAGRVSAVIEKVISGSKFRVWIEKESCVIPLVLHSIRTEKIDPETNTVSLEHKNRAIQFAKDHLHLRDVEILVDSVDKRGGNFIGFVWLKESKRDFGLMLVEEGLAAVYHPTAQRAKAINYNEYASAEKRAQKARKGLWVDYDEEAEEQRRKELQARRAEEKSKRKDEIVSVVVTEILDGATFYYQVLGTPEHAALQQLMQEMNAANLDAVNADGVSFKVKDNVAAKFTGDDRWYRGRIESVEQDGTFSVYYIDYGNTEILTRDRIKPLGDEFSVKTLPPQARLGRLAYIKTPSDEDFAQDAAAFLQEMTLDNGKEKVMVANIQYREGDVAYLILGDPNTQVHVNAALLRAGLAQLQRRDRDKNQLVKKLREQEALAKKAHLNIWQYGDYTEDDDE